MVEVMLLNTIGVIEQPLPFFALRGPSPVIRVAPSTFPLLPYENLHSYCFSGELEGPWQVPLAKGFPLLPMIDTNDWKHARKLLIKFFMKDREIAE
jgi:hypothetical protein